MHEKNALMRDVLIGIDLGTTRCRSAVYDIELNVLGDAYLEYPLIKISEREIEQDADEWWRLVKKVVKASLEKSNAASCRVKGISVSSQGIATVPVDRNCKPLRNAISWLDTRAVNETEMILERFDRFYIYRATGKRISELYTLPKIIWIKNNEPDVYSRTYKFLMPHDFIVSKLCGSFLTDHTLASGTLVYDINSRSWCKKILETFDIVIDKLPEIRMSGTLAGTITPQAAEEIGLPGGVPVSVGGQDQKCAVLGAGIGNGMFTVSLGTATAIEKIFEFPVTDDQMRIPVFSYLFKDRWVMEGVINTSGASLKWLKNSFFDGKSYRELDKMVEESGNDPGNVFFYPLLSGANSPDWYKNSKGCFYGITLSTRPADIIKSVMEGIAYHIKSNIQVMENADKPSEDLRIFGGGASSNVWCDIIANVTGKRVSTLYTHETACLGAAILAGLGAGIFKSTNEPCKNIKIKNVFMPDKARVKLYEVKYRHYVEMQDRIMK